MATPNMERHRDKNGEINRKHGNTLVSTLRKVYGDNFAPEFGPNEKLSDVLAGLEERSLTKLIADHEAGKLGDKLADPRVGNG